MEKLYYEKNYVKNFEATVLECRLRKDNSFEVILDRTAFYPEGGGQPADRGILGMGSVLDVRERDGEIVHITDKPATAGSRITGTIDWERRFNHMQNHSGEHLLSGIVHKNYGLDNVGFHMGKEEVTVDFNGFLTPEQIDAAELEVNELIWENVPMKESYPTKAELAVLNYRSKKELEGQVRIVEFPGGDVCACCGTHVNTTGEIGILKITGVTRYKTGVRVSMLCGKRALLDYQKKQKSVTGISVHLSVKTDQVLRAVEKLKEEGVKKEAKISQMSKELLERKVFERENSKAPLLLFEEGLTPAQLRQYCTMLYEGEKGSVVLVCSGENESYQYAMGSSTRDMRALCKSLNEKLNGRGGASPLLAQGTFCAAAVEIKEAFEKE